MVEIVAQTIQGDAGCTLERCDGGFDVNKAVPAQRSEFSYRNAVPCHHVGLACILTAHDFATFVTELEWRNLLVHHFGVARRVTTCNS